MIYIMPQITFIHFYNHIVNKYHGVPLDVNFRSTFFADIDKSTQWL